MNPSDPQGDLLQAQPASLSPSPVDQLRAQYRSLHSLVVVMLVASILLGAGVALFLGKQMMALRAQLQAARAEASTKLVEFRDRNEPLMRQFVHTLQAFAATNRDFQPILERHRTWLFPYFVAATSAAPASVTTQAPPAKVPPK